MFFFFFSFSILKIATGFWYYEWYFMEWSCSAWCHGSCTIQSIFILLLLVFSSQFSMFSIFTCVAWHIDVLRTRRVQTLSRREQSRIVDSFARSERQRLRNSHRLQQSTHHSVLRAQLLRSSNTLTIEHCLYVGIVLVLMLFVIRSATKALTLNSTAIVIRRVSRTRLCRILTSNQWLIRVNLLNLECNNELFFPTTTTINDKKKKKISKKKILSCASPQIWIV